MARKTRASYSRRSTGTKGRKPLVYWPIEANFSLGTLAAGSLLSGAILTLSHRAYFVRAKLVWSMNGHTAGEGPLNCGLADGDLSNTEKLEAIDASPTRPSDVIANERARRPVRTSGAYPGLNDDEVLNNGVAIYTSLMFAVDEDQSLEFWCKNNHASSLTTGTQFRVIGTISGRWL